MTYYKNTVIGQLNPIQPSPTKSLGEIFKPKKAGKDTSHVVFVLDGSGSMQSSRQATIEAFNGFLKGQQDDEKESGIKTYASLYVFDGYSLKAPFLREPVSDVKPLDRHSYNPLGATNLLDAIGGVMLEINEDFQSKSKKERDSLIICILTDGHENSSWIFDNADIKQMIEKAEGKNWGFTFMGANIDAFAVGSAMGFRHENTIQFDIGNIDKVAASTSRMASSMKSAYATGVSSDIAYASSGYTEKERDDSNG